MSLLQISLALLLAGAPVSPNATASIHGVVVTSETNVPVVHALVVLRPLQDDSLTPAKAGEKSSRCRWLLRRRIRTARSNSTR